MMFVFNIKSARFGVFLKKNVLLVFEYVISYYQFFCDDNLVKI